MTSRVPAEASRTDGHVRAGHGGAKSKRTAQRVIFAGRWYGTGDQPGAILLLVMWTVGLLALLGTQLLSTSRTELRTMAAMAEAALAQAAADGAVYEAVWHLADGADSHWPADHVPRMTRIGTAMVVVTIENLAGRLNPNTAPGGLIGAVLVQLGTPADRAMALGATVFDWHMPGRLASPGGAKLPAYRAAGLTYGPPGQPFETDAEIGAVLGMTPDLMEALRPYLSIYNEGAIDPKFAAPVVRQALEDTGTNQPETPGRSDTVEIVAMARRGGAAFLRRAVVRFRPTERFQILNWTVGP